MSGLAWAGQGGRCLATEAAPPLLGYAPPAGTCSPPVAGPSPLPSTLLQRLTPTATRPPTCPPARLRRAITVSVDRRGSRRVQDRTTQERGNLLVSVNGQGRGKDRRVIVESGEQSEGRREGGWHEHMGAVLMAVLLGDGLTGRQLWDCISRGRQCHAGLASPLAFFAPEEENTSASALAAAQSLRQAKPRHPALSLFTSRRGGLGVCRQGGHDARPLQRGTHPEVDGEGLL